MKSECKIKDLLDFGCEPCQTFHTVVHYRNDLVHAAVSRPVKVSPRTSSQQKDTQIELDKLPPGWALKCVVELARALNKKAGTTAPDWLQAS